MFILGVVFTIAFLSYGDCSAAAGYYGCAYPLAGIFVLASPRAEFSDRIERHLERCGFVVMKKPPSVGGGDNPGARTPGR